LQAPDLAAQGLQGLQALQAEAAQGLHPWLSAETGWLTPTMAATANGITVVASSRRRVIFRFAFITSVPLFFHGSFRVTDMTPPTGCRQISFDQFSVRCRSTTAHAQAIPAIVTIMDVSRATMSGLGAVVGLALVDPVLPVLPGATASLAQEVPVPAVVMVPAGPFIAGSDRAEREAAYRLDEAAYRHGVTRERQWYENERPRSVHDTGRFWITRTPITNRQYEVFVDNNFREEPDVDKQTWDAYGLIHPYSRTAPYRWAGGPTEGREDHPVVLVTIADAYAYAGWLSERTARSWRLPTELEWEKAARGTDGRRFPWGETFDPALLNSHDAGPFGTVPVGRYPDGASPFGMLDAAGQVFEWTLSPGNPGRFVVKGGSWDDKGCGVCRPAARHARPEQIKHILIGFRLILEEPAQ